MRKVVAICCSDIHLSTKPPVARAGEEDWLRAQARPLWQLKKLAEEHDVVILCAGDIFDRWNSPPELINWAIKHLPKMYAIPGQHDLPNHRLEDIHRSAYWTLVEAGIVTHVPDLESPHIGWGIELRGFPWGTPLRYFKPDRTDALVLSVALVHQYVWVPNRGYPGALKEDRLAYCGKNLKGWDIVIFGDNHLSFLCRSKGTTVFNCGSFQRRNSDQIGYNPQVGLLYNDGSIEPKCLDCSDDVIQKRSTAIDVKEKLDIEDFLAELTKLESSELDFREAIKQAMHKARPSVKELILEAMDNE